jgi:hypothetical protein
MWIPHETLEIYMNRYRIKEDINYRLSDLESNVLEDEDIDYDTFLRSKDTLLNNTNIILGERVLNVLIGVPDSGVIECEMRNEDFSYIKIIKFEVYGTVDIKEVHINK